MWGFWGVWGDLGRWIWGCPLDYDDRHEHLRTPTQMSKALDTSRKAVGGGGSKGRAGRGARQQLDFIVEGMRSGV